MWKSSKDRLIEFLEEELGVQRGYVRELQEASLRLREELDAERKLAAEAISLASEMAKLIPDQKAAVENPPERQGPSRTMQTYLQRQSELSKQRAIERLSLVAAPERKVV